MRQRTPVSANTRTAPIWPPAYTTPRIAAKPDRNEVGTHPQPHRPSRGHARHRANRAHPHTLNEIQITDAGPHPLRMHHGLQSERRNVQLIVRTSAPPSSSTVPVSYLKCSTIGSRHPLTRCLLTHPYLTHSSSSATAS